jgi:hypothetical protein
MRRSSLAEGVHLRVPHACAQAFGDDNVTESLGALEIPFEINSLS